MPAMRRALVVALIGLTSVVLDARAPRAVSLILTGGTVITIDAAHRVIPHGAVAVDGTDIVAVDTRGSRGRRVHGKGSRRYDGRHRVARARQHARPCADGALSRARRRPRADGLAPALHLSCRGEDRLAGDGARRHEAGRARDDSVGDDDLHRHVLLRGGDRADRPRRGPPRRPRRDHHQVSGRRREDARGRVEARRSVHRGVQARPADHAGRRAALRVHARPRHAARVPRSGAEVRRAAPDSSRRDAGRGADHRRSRRT